MPLIRSASKKAFGENVKTEMNAGKPQDQSLAISYSIQRKNKNKKKMAYGGAAESTNEPSVPAPKKTPAEPSGFMSNHATEGSKPPRKMESSGPTMPEYMADHFAKGGTAYYADGTEVKPNSPMKAEALDEDTRKQMGDDAMSADEYNPNEDPANLAFGGAAEDDGEPAVPGRKPDNMRPPEDEYMADHFAEGGEAEGHYKSVSDAIRAKKRKMMADGGTVDLDENAREEPNNEDDMSYEALKKENYSEDAGLEHMGSLEDSNQKSVRPPGEDSHDMVDEFADDVDYDERGANDTDMLNSIMRKMKSKRNGA